MNHARNHVSEREHARQFFRLANLRQRPRSELSVLPGHPMTLRCLEAVLGNRGQSPICHSYGTHVPARKVAVKETVVIGPGRPGRLSAPRRMRRARGSVRARLTHALCVIRAGRVTHLVAARSVRDSRARANWTNRSAPTTNRDPTSAQEVGPTSPFSAGSVAHQFSTTHPLTIPRPTARHYL